MFRYAIVVVVAFAAVFLIVHFLIRRYHTQNELLQAELHLQNSYLEFVEHVHILQHDIKNHIYAIEDLHEKGETEKALSYLANLRKRIEAEKASLKENNHD